MEVVERPEDPGACAWCSDPERLDKPYTKSFKHTHPARYPSSSSRNCSPLFRNLNGGTNYIHIFLTADAVRSSYCPAASNLFSKHREWRVGWTVEYNCLTEGSLVIGQVGVQKPTHSPPPDFRFIHSVEPSGAAVLALQHTACDRTEELILRRRSSL